MIIVVFIELGFCCSGSITIACGYRIRLLMIFCESIDRSTCDRSIDPSMYLRARYVNDKILTVRGIFDTGFDFMPYFTFAKAFAAIRVEILRLWTLFYHRFYSASPESLEVFQV